MKKSITDLFNNILAKIPGSRWQRRQFAGYCQSGAFDKVRAVIEKNPQAVNWKDAAGSTALHWVGAHYNKDAAEFLIAHGADVNATNIYGNTPLHHAAGTGAGEIVEVLTKQGASIDALNSEGDTPLMVAASTPNGLRSMPALMVAGANTAKRNKAGKNVLDIAKGRPDPKIAEEIKSMVQLRALLRRDKRMEEEEKRMAVLTKGSERPVKVLKPIVFKSA